MEHTFAAIYDRLNNQPHIQAIIQDFYYEGIGLRQQSTHNYKMNNLNLKAITITYWMGNKNPSWASQFLSSMGDSWKWGGYSFRHFCYDPSGYCEWDPEELESKVGKGLLNIDRVWRGTKYK